LQDLEANTALSVLSEYLTDSAVSVLSQAFIEIEDPIATTIRLYASYQMPCILTASFESVPVEELDTLEGKFLNVLQNVVDDGIDMERMKTIVKMERSRTLLYVEKSPASVMSNKLINEALYGTLDGKTLKDDIKDLVYYDKLAKWSEEQWIALLKRYDIYLIMLIVDGGLIILTYRF
jgi:Zn-dependent M16 (insulinase) family peptidase